MSVYPVQLLARRGVVFSLKLGSRCRCSWEAACINHCLAALGYGGGEVSLQVWCMMWDFFALWDRRTPANLVPQSPHLGAVPFFLMCRYRSSPPGVLMMRTLLDLVLYDTLRRFCKH